MWLSLTSNKTNNSNHKHNTDNTIDTDDNNNNNKDLIWREHSPDHMLSTCLLIDLYDMQL